MKSESFLQGFRRHVARFVSISHGFIHVERKVSLFPREKEGRLYEKERVYDRHEERAMGIYETSLSSASKVRVEVRFN